MGMKKSETYRLGIDIGSTTVKIAILDGDGKLRFSDYQRHFANIQETLADLIDRAGEGLGDVPLAVSITGSGGLALAKHIGVPFCQEVVAVARALKAERPDTDVAIELGGEDAKIIYFRGGVDQRMNGICAGGTGSFIDQMASLLDTDAAGLDVLARDYRMIYPIAARCGVFAKTDIQPLINEGAAREDLAASIFQAVVNQTISGLAQGKPIRGHVAFLGGPLHFMPELRNAFVRTLHLRGEEIIAPEHSHLFAAIGAALDERTNQDTILISELSAALRHGIRMDAELKRMEPLFRSQAEYQAFQARHGKTRVRTASLASYRGDAFLGIDAGSTTTKLALVAEDGALLYKFYANNEGSPIQAAIRAVKEIRELLPEGVRIAWSCSTGYGEALLKSAFQLDEGEVETIAHYYAAAFFEPEVDCILDIGGQDMKCIMIKDGTVDSVQLNEACSSGCGSFLETFAKSLGYSVEDFAQKALFAENPTDLGSRCTVFMNSNVKQAQKEGAGVEDISAGLACSVIKNALFKVIKVTEARDLGEHIVVQGGTFYNDAVLRAFENILGKDVVRPDIAGIMGAFGAALIARERFQHLQKQKPGQVQEQGQRQEQRQIQRQGGQGKEGKAGKLQGARPVESRMLPLEKIIHLQYRTHITRCQGCNNHCVLTVNQFGAGRNFISGNRCERGLGRARSRLDVPNLFRYKLKRMFDYEPLPLDKAVRGEVGIPRVLNMYENYPFWAVFFRMLKFRTVLSPASTRQIYELGIESIPSESECYPAKIAHGHIEWLIRTMAGRRAQQAGQYQGGQGQSGQIQNWQKQDGMKQGGQSQGGHTQNGAAARPLFLFYPCIPYERNETPDAGNHYNCPMVTSYAENIKNNVETLAEYGVLFLKPFLAFTNEKILTEQLVRVFTDPALLPESVQSAGALSMEKIRQQFQEWAFRAEEVRAAAHAAWLSLEEARADMERKGEETLRWMRDTGHRGIVLAGRPYHVDPEIHHGIPELITSYHYAVLTEDSVSHLAKIDRPTIMTDQWMYHTRLYRAAEFVKSRKDLDFVQLNSFGCGLDAVTVDQARDILTGSGRIYTVLKIDEVNNLGAARIRIRSLLAAIRVREEKNYAPALHSAAYQRKLFTREMKEGGYTILCPQMSPIHFRLLEAAIRSAGYNIVVLENTNRAAIDTGLKYVNNDACYPSIIVIGQIMDALLSGKYDLHRTAVIMSQTGGGCRASNYISFIRRALERAGMSQIPVISLNANGMEKTPGFQFSLPLLEKSLQALVYGDIFMRTLYRTRPYERIPGSADALHRRWEEKCIASLSAKRPRPELFRWNVRAIIRDFDRLPLRENLRKPRVGVVGEILVKFSPLANNDIVGLLEREGAEAVVPDLMDFLLYSFYNQNFKNENLGSSLRARMLCNAAIELLEFFRRTARKEFQRSKRFTPPEKIQDLAAKAREYVSLGNQTGEGWFLTGEMLELLSEGVGNIVCTQPFGCLPNHIVGKGVIKELKRRNPEANIIAVDYDAGASEVNQLNRIKLMLSVAQQNLNEKENRAGSGKSA